MLMSIKSSLLIPLCLVLFLLTSCSKQEGPSAELKQREKIHSPVKWQDWSDEVFAQAKAEKKLVILDLEAIWCHWCHVMEAQTYSNPEVVEILENSFMAVKVDQDSRPDLSNLYRDYGWPATIIFKADGTELAKRRGFIEPEKMLELLKAIVADPSPGKYDSKGPSEFSKQAFLTDDLKEKLSNNFFNSYDEAKGGLKSSHKYMEKDSVEYALILAQRGKEKAKAMAQKTLDQALRLFDPAWGGVYQYSTYRDWNNPHYEKLATIQAHNLRVYSQAYMILEDKKYLEAAQEVHRYISEFLTSSEGAFYTSQDADLVQGEHSDDYFKLSDKARRKQGIPSVDKNIYSFQNGLIIDALVYLYDASQDEQYLEQAIKAANWIIKNRSITGGGFSHGENDVAGPFLNDNLYMARAFLNLYVASSDSTWLDKASQTAQFINKNFKSKIGFKTFTVSGTKQDQLLANKSKLVIEENIDLVRFMNLLHHYSGFESFKTSSEHAMKYLATEEIALRSITEPGILMADAELAGDPVHMTIVGPKGSKQAKVLFKAALNYPATFYKRVEWWDPKGPDLPNPDVLYPDLAKPAAFACSNQTCSLPAFTKEDLFDYVSAS